jgi:hypothetical protein
LKGERWGSPLVQEKYREGKACDRRHPHRIMMMMMMMMIIIIIIILGTSHIIRKVLQCEA